MGNHCCHQLAEIGNSLACSCILGIACWPRTTSSLPKNKSLWAVPVMSSWCEIEHEKRTTSKEFCEGLHVLAHKWVLYLQDGSSLCFLISCFWRFSLQVEIWDSLELDMGLNLNWVWEEYLQNEVKILSLRFHSYLWSSVRVSYKILSGFIFDWTAVVMVICYFL